MLKTDRTTQLVKIGNTVIKKANGNYRYIDFVDSANSFDLQNEDSTTYGYIFVVIPTNNTSQSITLPSSYNKISLENLSSELVLVSSDDNDELILKTNLVIEKQGLEQLDFVAITSPATTNVEPDEVGLLDQASTIIVNIT